MQARHFAHDQQRRRLNAGVPYYLNQVRKRAGDYALLRANQSLEMYQPQFWLELASNV